MGSREEDDETGLGEGGWLGGPRSLKTALFILPGSTCSRPAIGEGV